MLKINMKSKEELLKQFKKANKEYKVKLATKYGMDVSSYLRFLTYVDTPKTTTKTKARSTTSKSVKPTIHIVDILDASGSMGGSGNSKYENSKKGILSGIEDLRKVKDVKYTYTLIEFVQSRNIKTHFYLAPLPTNINFHGATGNNTPLYSTVYDTLILLQNVNPTDKGYVENCLITADQFTKEEVVNKTRAAEIFAANPEVVMTVSFQKQTKEADVIAEITEAYENSTPKEFATKLKKAVKTGLNGIERTLVGFHKGNSDEFGRISMLDLDIVKDISKSYDNRIRNVDPRTINFLIVKEVKYTVK